MKKAIGYIRRSTTGQADNYSKDGQKEDILEFARQNDYEIIEWKEDLISGATESRPAFDEILNGNMDAEAVIVAKLDRLSRDTNIYFYFKYKLKSKGMELISANSQEDFGGLGIFAPVIETLIAVMAEQERERINQRMTSGRDIKSKQGGYSGGKAPYGYKAVDGELVINEKESENVKRIFELREGGMSLRKIASNVDYGRNGKEMTAGTIKSILDNEEFYKGIYSYSGNVAEGKHERILN